MSGAVLSRLVGPLGQADTSWVVPAARSRMNTSWKPLVSPGTRFEAEESKATYRPSRDSAGSALRLLAGTPPAPTETNWVVLVLRTRAYTSRLPLVSPATRLVASETKATTSPLPEIAGNRLCPLPPAPLELTDTRRVVPADRSRTKMSWTPLPSPLTRLEAADPNATCRPSSEIAGNALFPLACPPPV